MFLFPKIFNLLTRCCLSLGMIGRCFFYNRTSRLFESKSNRNMTHFEMNAMREVLGRARGELLKPYSSYCIFPCWVAIPFILPNSFDSLFLTHFICLYELNFRDSSAFVERFHENRWIFCRFEWIQETSRTKEGMLDLDE